MICSDELCLWLSQNQLSIYKQGFNFVLCLLCNYYSTILLRNYYKIIIFTGLLLKDNYRITVLYWGNCILSWNRLLGNQWPCKGYNLLMKCIYSYYYRKFKNRHKRLYHMIDFNRPQKTTCQYTKILYWHRYYTDIDAEVINNASCWN